MTFKEHIKSTFKLAIPISIGQLGHIMMGIVDSVMVGRIGAAPLAAASLVNGLFFLVLVLGIGMSLALTPLIAIATGSGKNENCGKILNHSLLVNVIFTFLLMFIIYFGADFIDLLKQPPAVAILAKSYLKILAVSSIPFILFQTYRQFLEGLSFVNPPMVIAIAANLLNAFFNWVFIFGNLGAPKLGLDGAGYSTLGTRAVMAIVIILYVLRKKELKIYNPFPTIRNIDYNLIKKIISIGLPSGFQYFIEIAAFSFGAILMGWFGTISLAAHQIAINLASTTYMIILGIASAGTIRVGNAVGKKDITETRRAGFSALAAAMSVMFCFGLSFVIFRNLLPHFYINNHEVVELASKLLIIAALFQLSDGTQATAIGILRGLTDVKFPTVLSFLSYWLIGIPVALLLGFHFHVGPIGVWIGFWVGLTLIAILLTMRFNLKSKQIVNM